VKAEGPTGGGGGGGGGPSHELLPRRRRWIRSSALPPLPPWQINGRRILLLGGLRELRLLQVVVASSPTGRRCLLLWVATAAASSSAGATSSSGSLCLFLFPCDGARARRRVGKECSEEREPQECTCSPRSLQNAVAAAAKTGAATVCSHSPFCRCGAGCRDRWRQSKNSVQIRQQEQKKKLAFRVHS
jgi:hypothetical protein